jgi:4-hydroxy-3-methylbut-2-enyl diphosphate reductase
MSKVRTVGDELAPEPTIVVAGPRGFCAGVAYAVEVVNLVLEQHGAPVYVRHEIVHNRHVCDGLRARGARFVEDLTDVPNGSLLIFSAHGVAPAVREDARARELRVVDATCPLVTKVHVEALRYAREGYEILLIGHRGHVEVAGTLGHAPDQMHLIETAADVETVRVRNPERVAVVTQTTLSVDDTREIIEAIRRRFPDVRTPRKDDICYATQNRQTAVKELARQTDIVLVIGSPTSSNASRLVEVARNQGRPAHLIQEAADVDPDWLAGVSAIGLTAGASTPESLVQATITHLNERGFTRVRELITAEENVTFPLPRELRAGFTRTPPATAD